MPVHFETTSATSSSVTSSFSIFRSRWSSASAGVLGLELTLELDERAVAELGRSLQVGVALRALGLGARLLDARLQLADAVDPLLLLLPVRGHRVPLFLEVGELLLEAGEAVLRRLVGLLAQRGLLDLELADAPLDLVDLDRHRVDLDPQARRALVDQVDRLVGQEPPGDVAVAEHGGRDERRVLDAHAVVHLVALLQAAQDADRVLDARLFHEHRLEAALERRVLLDVLAVLVERGGADRPQLAAGEHRLQHVAGVHRALGRTGADDRVQLVDERDDLALGVGDLLQHGLEPLLELAAVLRAGDHGAEVERDQPLVLQRGGHVAVDDPLGESLDDRGLADAGLADQHRVVLRAAREHLDRAADLLVPADHRVELAGARRLGQVPPVLLERLERVLRVLARDALTSADLREGGERGVTRQPGLEEDARGSRAGVARIASSRCSVEMYSSVSASASGPAASSSFAVAGEIRTSTSCA